jgi:hypothetical protein
MKISTLTLLFFSICNYAFAQKIDEDKVDAFTNVKSLKTKYETLMSNGSFIMPPTKVTFCCSKVDGIIAVELKTLMNNGEFFIIEKDESFQLKFDNNEVLELKALEKAIAVVGGGSPGMAGSALRGVHSIYVLDQHAIEMIKKNTLKSVRIHTSKGYIEELKIPEKTSNKLKQCLGLVSG